MIMQVCASGGFKRESIRSARFETWPHRQRWRARALEPIDRQKIGDAWGSTGKAHVDRATAALRYYGLLEYQGVGKERE